MRANVIGIIIGLIIVGVLWASGYASTLVERMQPQDPFQAALAGVMPCTVQGESVSCARPFVIRMLQERSVPVVLESLSNNLGPQQCHYIGHVVGQQLFAQTNDVEGALAQCSRACDSACIHGVIGQAFADALGYPDPEADDFDYRHLSPQNIATIGKSLCVSLGACHGVGHVLFQAYKEFKPAFQMCRTIGGASVTTCYNGVTMEYADILSNRHMREVPDVAFPQADAFDELCAFSDIEEARACFRYFSRVVEVTLAREGVAQKDAQTRVREICESYPSGNIRVSCFSGIGSHAAYTVLTDTAGAVAQCEGYTTALDEAACMVGVVSVATGDRTKPLATFCTAQTTSEMRASCYQALFHFLASGLPTYDVGAICGPDNPVCSAQAKRTNVDPWQDIQRVFKKR